MIKEANPHLPRSSESVWNLVNALDVDLLPAVHLPSQRARSGVDDSPQPIRATQRLIGLQSVPRVNSDMVFPESLPLEIETLLLRDLKSRDGLPGVLLRVPHFANVFNRLVLEVLAKLHLEQVLSVVFVVERLQPSVKDIAFVLVGLDDFVEELLLRF